MCVPLWLYVFLVLFLWLIHILCLCGGVFFSYFDLFVFIFSYFIIMLNVCLFFDERARKTMDLGDRADLRGWGRGNGNQDILYEKRYF